MGLVVSDFEIVFWFVIVVLYVLVCFNGIMVLYFVLVGLGIGEGDVCIVLVIIFFVIVNVVFFCGVEVVFCDVDVDIGLMI